MTDVHTGAPEASTLEEQLDAWLEGVAEELDGPPRDVQQVTSLVGALAAVRRRRVEAGNLADARIQAITGWLEQVTAPLERREEELEALIAGWARAEWERTQRATWKLPTGTVKALVRQPRLLAPGGIAPSLLVDLVGAVSPSYVRRKEEVAVGDIKAEAVAGDLLEDADALDVPDGYEPRQVLVPHADGDRYPLGEDHGPYVVLPGMVMLAPAAGRAGRHVKVNT
jgi:hypothetical protein